MGRLIRFLIFLIFAGFVGLVGYAYLGPFLGVDFAPKPVEMRVPVTLDANDT